MKKYKLLFNLLLLVIIVLSLIVLGITIEPLINSLNNFNSFKELIDNGLSTPFEIESYNKCLRILLQNIFSIIFLIIISTIEITVLYVLNFKVWKEKH